MKTARERTEDYYAQVDAIDDMDVVRTIAREFNTYYATLEGEDKEAADQLIHERVVEQGRRVDEAIKRLEAAAAPLIREASGK